ncbi:MAG: sigma-70 family RNA polymerase sigma factor [Planctomycetota bacterium]|nr:sigma-70 family RNA polymerase sigma factor [Planctomycetota bacterium]
MTSPVPSPVARPARRFATTRWSLIIQARHGANVPARAALQELCEAYWLPVYGFMRRQTKDLHQAQDLTQGFFASLLSRDALADLHPERGRFRTFLLAAAKHFACNEFDKQSAAIQGGKVVRHSLDYELGERQLLQELCRDDSPEAIFERRWALAMLDLVLARLRDEYEFADKISQFESLSPFLSGDQTGAGYQSACETLQLSPEAVRVAAHRMRKRYRQILREEISHTTATPQEVDDEIRHLFESLRRT